MGAHDGSHDGQAQPVATAVAANAGGVSAVEPFKDLTGPDRVDAGTMVADLELGATGVAADGDLDVRALRCVIHSVTNKIGDNLAQSGLVALDGGWLQVTRQTEQSHLPGGVKGTSVLHGVGGQHGEIHGPLLEGTLAVEPGQE